MNQRDLSTVIFGGLLLCCSASASAASPFELFFMPVPVLPAGTVSPEGCYNQPGIARGTLSPTPPVAGAVCHSGLLGVPLAIFAGDPSDPQVYPTAEFTSPPFADGLELQGPATLSVNYFDETRFLLLNDTNDASLFYELDEIRANGDVAEIAAGVAIEQLLNDSSLLGEQTGTFNVGAYTVARGSRLRLRLLSLAPATTSGRLLFGGDSLLGSNDVYGDTHYGDASIAFVTRDDDSGSAGADVLAGALPAALLVPLLAGALIRRQRRCALRQRAQLRITARPYR